MSNSLFQFLIVRLKGKPCGAAKAPTVISIPYSTIKSFQSWNVLHIIRISIPYSTIKRPPILQSCQN